MKVYVLNVEEFTCVFDSLEKALASFDNFIIYRGCTGATKDIDKEEGYAYLKYDYEYEGEKYQYIADIISYELNNDVFYG